MSYRISQMPRIYLDNASTTPIDPRVFDAMLPYLRDSFGNASSVHGFGQEARNGIDKARRQVSGLLNCAPNEIIFTSGGTESNNIAIRGLASRFPNGHIVTTQIEHSAVREVVRNLGELGFEITEVAPNADGLVEPDRIASAIRENTFLVTVMLANNELGTIQPVREISDLVIDMRRDGREIYLHSDAVQALGKMPVDAKGLGCDLMSFSSHKLYAPKGTGALYLRKGVKILPLAKGGPHEKGLRPGTENVAGIVAFGEAASICSSDLATEGEGISSLRTDFESLVHSKISGVSTNGGEHRLPGISNISFEGVSGESLLILLDQKGIAVSTGSACASGTIEASHVLLAIGRSEEEAKSAIRFSFGRFNDRDHLKVLSETLVSAVAELRGLD
jgi:cysteine desulfurase